LSSSLKPSAARAALLESRARLMRHHPTPSEQVLWQALRGQRLGVAFRRQVPLGPYIVDFLAPKVGLVVEVDGGYHAARHKADARRERWLRHNGCRAVRVRAALVFADLTARSRSSEPRSELETALHRLGRLAYELASAQANEVRRWGAVLARVMPPPIAPFKRHSGGTLSPARLGESMEPCGPRLGPLLCTRR